MKQKILKLLELAALIIATACSFQMLLIFVTMWFNKSGNAYLTEPNILIRAFETVAVILSSIFMFPMLIKRWRNK